MEGDIQGYTYSIITSTPVPFDIEPHGNGGTATIYATGALDRETRDSYTFTVN